MRNSFLFLLLCIFSGLKTVQGQDIFLTRDEILAIRKKTTIAKWARVELEKLLQQADRFVEMNIQTEIPSRSGNWNHYYRSPEEHVLTPARQIGPFQWEHKDVATGKVYTSDTSHISRDLDGVLIGKVHLLMAKGILQLALAYRLTDKTIYAEKAKEILLRYASFYQTLSLRNNRGGTNPNSNGYGKLFPQALEESEWLIEALSGASLVWETLREQERSDLRDKLFFPMSEYISHDRTKEPFIHNIDCWEISAIGLTGLFFNDQKRIALAFRDTTRGYYKQIEKGINKDGFWHEMSLNYHFYAFYPLMLLNRAANHAGMNVDQRPLKSMLDIPLKVTDHKFSVPPFNDSDRLNLGTYAFLYEWGYHVFQDTAYIRVLTIGGRGYEPDMPNLFTGFALLFGEPFLKSAPRREIASFNFPESGLAALTTGEGAERLWVNVKYGLRYAFHHHADAGNFEIAKGNEVISADPGKVNYASDQHTTWYRTSLSHNTFVVNGKQQPMNMKIECLDFRKERDIEYIRIRSTGKFSGHEVTSTRTIALVDANTIFVTDQFNSIVPDTIDVSYHQNGTLLLTAGKPWVLPQLSGYKYLKKVVSDTIPLQDFVTRFDNGRIVKATYYRNAPTRWMVGEGISPDDKNANYLIMRRQANAAPLYWSISLDGQGAKFSAEVKDGVKYLILSASGKLFTFAVGDPPAGKSPDKNAYRFLLAR
jgi:oligo-alginate lyase